MEKRDAVARLVGAAAKFKGDRLRQEARKTLNQVEGPSDLIIYDEDCWLVSPSAWQCLMLGAVESDTDKLMQSNLKLIELGMPELVATAYGRVIMVCEDVTPSAQKSDTRPSMN